MKADAVAPAGPGEPSGRGWLPESAAARRLLVLLLLLTLWRLLAAGHRDMELYADEAQYWIWSLQPDWGYYSKPPMVAWAIALGTALFGDAEMGVRALSVVVYPLTAWVLFLGVRRLYAGDPLAERIAFWSGLSFAALPMTSLGAWLITTDAFLILFWSLSLYCAVLALESDRWQHWLLLGLALGLGLLSKYSMVFFGLGAAAYLLLVPERRRLLARPGPYLAAGVAFLVLSPNILWNARHHFVSYQHTAEISQLDRSLLHPGALAEFFLAQFAVFGPILAAGLLLIALRPRRWRADRRLALLAALSLAPLAAFLTLSLLSRAFANWAAFVYVPAAALVAAVWIRQERGRWLAAALAVNLAIGALAYHLPDITAALDIQLSRKSDPYARVTGYRALGREVAERLRAHPQARLLGDDRKLYALLRYYARPHSASALYLNPGGGIDNHFALTVDVRQAPHGSFLLISRQATEEALRGWFETVRALPPIRFQLYPDHAPEYSVWLLTDYRGPGG